MEMTAYGSAIKTAERNHETFHSDLNEAVYYMVFPHELTIYHCFKSRVDRNEYLNELEMISKIYKFLDYGWKKFK